MLFRQSNSLQHSEHPRNRYNGNQPNQGKVIFLNPLIGTRMTPAIKVKIHSKPVCLNGPIAIPATDEAAMTKGTDIKKRLSRLLFPTRSSSSGRSLV